MLKELSGSWTARVPGGRPAKAEAVRALAKEHGLDVEERRISIEEWRGGVESGDITEVFACGTAAVITPVGVLRWEGGEVGTGSAEAGPVASSLRQSLLDLQYGRAEDVHGWLRRLA